MDRLLDIRVCMLTPRYSRFSVQGLIRRKAGMRTRCRATSNSPREFKSQEEVSSDKSTSMWQIKSLILNVHLKYCTCGCFA